VAVQEKFRSHYSDLETVSTLEQLALRVHKAIKELAIILKKYFEEKTAKRDTATAAAIDYSNFIPSRYIKIFIYI
jgi:hypothetical protein